MPAFGSCAARDLNRESAADETPDAAHRSTWRHFLISITRSMRNHSGFC